MFGISDAFMIVADFQRKLMEIGVDAILPIVPDIFRKQGFNIKSDVITLIISLNPDYRDLLDITSILRKRESRIILLQGFEDERFGTYAEELVNIECSEVEPGMRMIANRTLAGFVLDIIYLLIYLNINDQSYENEQKRLFLLSLLS